VPADEPDATTGAARTPRGVPGRHRHARPGTAPLTPEDDVPPVPPRGRGRSRHARHRAEPGAPGGAGYPDAGYRHDPHRDDPYGDDPYSAWYQGAPDSANSYTADSYDADPYSANSHGANSYGGDPHNSDPYRADPYTADPHDGDPHDGDPHDGDPHDGDRYRDASSPRGPYREPASRPRHDPHRGGDPYAYGDEPHEADRVHRDRDREPYRDYGYRDASYGYAPYHGAPRGGPSPNGTAADEPYRSGPAAEMGPPSRRATDAGGSTSDGRDPHDPPGRPPRTPPALPGLPNRRPGDPPAVPAELFVETTTETPPLRFDDDPPSDAATTDEPATQAAERQDAPRRAEAGEGKRPARGFGLSGALAGIGRGRERAAADELEHGPDIGHGHGHGPARPADRRVRILLTALLAPFALAALVGLVLLWPTGGPPATAQSISQEPVQAQVTASRATDCTPGSGDGACVAVVVHMADGPRPGRDLVQVVPVEPGSPQFSVGDRVVLGWSGANPDDAGSYQIVDFQRGAPLAWLAGLFAIAVLLLGRWRGLAALAALALTFVVLLLFVVPSILAGHNPLAVAVVGSCLIMFAVLYLTHGPSARTSTAVLGTLLSLALIGGLGAAFSAAAQLTGLDDQTSNLIASLGAGVDARGLLLAGVVIGALGVLDDVTVTQTSAVWELHAANPRLGVRGLFAAAMRIGRDHVASAVNTLVLAYAGAALPLLLVFSLSGRGFGEVVTSQDVATEIVRTLVGSIGLVASVPITTAIAAAVATRETPQAADT
jgi:uncharacterized membrane protein